MELSFGSLAAAFGAGVISFITPCVLPLLPAYLSLMSGYSVEELQAGKVSNRRLLRVTSLFVAGFAIVFVAAGAIASNVGQFLNANQLVIARVSGVLILLFGLVTLVLTFSRSPVFAILNREAHVSVRPSRLGNWAPPVMGLAFGFGWTPCIGPILGTILTVAASEQTVGSGALLLAVYALGLGLPFIASGVGAGVLLRTAKGLRRHVRKVSIASGVVMVTFGMLLLTGGFNVVRTAITNVWYEIPLLKDLNF